MKKFYIKLSPGVKGSQSAKRLAEALSNKLGYKVFRSVKDFPKKEALKYSGGEDKLFQYKWFTEHELPSLLFTVEQHVAKQYVENGNVVVGRQLLNASCGKGILIFEKPEEVVACPVYTVYKKKKREFRVHVFRDKVVEVVEKKARTEWTGKRDTRIRNLDNGYVFCKCDVEPEGLRDLALKAAPVVHSDFRGVDIGYNEKNNELFVIEVNSAPGIEGSNVSKYVETIVG